MTGPNGHIRVLLPDNTVFTLGPNSDLVLDDFVYDPDASTTKAAAQFTKGVLRWVTGKISGTKDIHIKVPVGDLGIRGTDFEALVGPNGAGYVKLFEGRIDLTENRTGHIVTLNGGQVIRFGDDGALSQPLSIGR